MGLSQGDKSGRKCTGIWGRVARSQPGWPQIKFPTLKAVLRREGSPGSPSKNQTPPPFFTHSPFYRSCHIYVCSCTRRLGIPRWVIVQVGKEGGSTWKKTQK